MTKINVMLAYGGQSSEHEVSLLSARNVLSALDTSKYEITLCFIDKNGQWWLQEAIEENTEQSTQLVPILGKKYFTTLPGAHEIRPDIFFPVLHGHNGEDGAVQGLMQLLGIPCVGPSLLSAAVTMDKDMTKHLLEYAGIPVVPWKTWLVQNQEPTYETVSNELGTDVFVKPANAGSSVGVSHVTSGESWSEVLHVAAMNSEMVLIEKTIYGREIEVAVLGNTDVEATMPGEIIAGEDFYSYDAKYSQDSTSEVRIPADLPDDISEKIKNYALTAYKIVEGRGMARVDFFVSDNGEIFLNEINSIPGFTNISMYPKLWQEQGVSYSELIDRLITLALE